MRQQDQHSNPSAALLSTTSTTTATTTTPSSSSSTSSYSSSSSSPSPPSTPASSTSPQTSDDEKRVPKSAPASTSSSSPAPGNNKPVAAATTTTTTTTTTPTTPTPTPTVTSKASTGSIHSVASTSNSLSRLHSVRSMFKKLMRKTPSPTPSESAAGAGAEAAAPTAAAAPIAPEKVVDVTAPSGDSQVATDVHMAGTVVGNGTSTSPSPSPGAGTHEGSLSTADNGTASTAASSVASPAPVAAAAQISLDQILGTDHESLEHPGLNGKPPTGWDEEVVDAPVKEGFCIECEDQPAQLRCDTCTDVFCEVCFAAQHRKGSRKGHKAVPLAGAVPTKSELKALEKTSAPEKKNDMDVDSDDDEDDDAEGSSDDQFKAAESASLALTLSSQPAVGQKVGDWFLERAKYIPLRLSLLERKYLRLLEAALNVSEYTDKIDTIQFGVSKSKRIVAQIRELCSIMSGLLLAADYKEGQQLFQNKDFQANEKFYQQVFELGRRHKIMNPDKMRTTYGKLAYLLQDSQIPEVKDMLGFSCVGPINTVYTTLEDANALDLLRDDLITSATQEIYSSGRTRREIQKDIRAKERAIEHLVSKYSRRGLSQEDVRQCIYSIGDNHAFLRANRDPCEQMIGYLKKYFQPMSFKDAATNLAIRSGRGGARLSHDHSVQYAYVLQSLTLWREILHDMFHLWSLAEEDLLSDRVAYQLRDTGQGLNRVQGAPKTSRLMHSILHKAQQAVGMWVGSSVIHMGDHNVPNALLFIDKYTQIYRILLPVCNTLAQLPALCQSKPALRRYVESEFGSGAGAGAGAGAGSAGGSEGAVRDGIEACTVEILSDFFRHGFDGSGADNFFDAGSCIDGRLTSAWNWCAQLEKKRYFHVFLLTGFVGFDGQW